VDADRRDARLAGQLCPIRRTTDRLVGGFAAGQLVGSFAAGRFVSSSAAGRFVGSFADSQLADSKHLRRHGTHRDHRAGEHGRPSSQ